MSRVETRRRRGRPVTKQIGLVILLGAALLAAAACSRLTPVVKIGLVGPFEGRYRAIGYDVIYSARLAVRSLNESGGIGRYRVALAAFDDSGEIDLAKGAAQALLVDPQVVAVVGHWLPLTTAAAAPVYERGGLALVAGGEEPFAALEPALLPQEFQIAYEEVTPFDEAAGPYAGPAHDAFALLWRALTLAEQAQGEIDRQGVAEALTGLQVDGFGGVVYQPPGHTD